MPSRFELFVANRYLRARRKEAVISAITLISVLGVAAGAMALVIGLGVNNGFRNTLQRGLLGATAHIDVTAKDTARGIEDWRALAVKAGQVPHVVAVAPALMATVYVIGPQSTGALLKGIDVDSGMKVLEGLRHLKAGSIERLRDPNADPPGLLIGARMIEDTGIELNSNIQVVSPQSGVLTPYGVRPSPRLFRVVGIFETGFFEVDDKFAFTSIPAEQKLLSIADAVNRIEINVDNLDHTEEIAKDVEKVVGSAYSVATWKEQNRQLMSALNMERVVTIITIGLIELVAALNIFIALVMMVMEKRRDIAVLMSMGARRQQVRWIFMMQGVLIGVVGSALGIAAGYALCYFANKYQWIPLNQAVYSLSFVPFEPRPIDGLWIAGAAVLVSFLATIYPATSATRIAPVEVLRYE